MIALGLKRPSAKDYLRGVKQAIPSMALAIVSIALIVAGGGFLVFDLYQWMNRSLGLNWASLITGLVCLIVGGFGIKSVQS
ncbi:MAG: hypothetical protein EBR01_11900 [Proteobacteria bacterium]|nr:hypothetical protein [Pseudomonadota bacterium]